MSTFKYYGGGTEDLRSRTGQEIQVLRELRDGDESDHSEVGQMFRVRFNDGFEADAFAEEIIPRLSAPEPKVQ